MLKSRSSLVTYSTEEKRTHAGHQTLELNNLIMGVESITFFLLGHACIKTMSCKVITLLLAMSKSATY